MGGTPPHACLAAPPPEPDRRPIGTKPRELKATLNGRTLTLEWMGAPWATQHVPVVLGEGGSGTGLGACPQNFQLTLPPPEPPPAQAEPAAIVRAPAGERMVLDRAVSAPASPLQRYEQVVANPLCVGKTYSIVVVSYYADSAAARSSQVEVVVPPGPSPPPLTGLTAQASHDAVHLYWKQMPATEYRVYKSGQLLEYLRPKRYASGEERLDTMYVDRNVSPGVASYEVRAVMPLCSYAPAQGSEAVSLATVSVKVPYPPVVGFADTHAHQFANLAFGGLLFWGQPYGPIDTALQWCTAAHGAGGVGDVLGNALRMTAGHLVGGHPQFDGWPTWNTLNHQQMYSDWLYRAFQGGLRLMVMHAVNNQVLCGLVNTAPGRTCDDMEAVGLQINGAKAMEQYIDAQSGGAGKGWYRIAYTPEQAREIIRGGKLAVVLGVEVDNLFGCRLNGPCTNASVRNALQTYYNLGVRHVFPIHFANNAFGGFSLQADFVNFNNKVLTGSYVQPYDCSPQGYQFRFGWEVPAGALALIGAVGYLNPIAGAAAGLAYSTYGPPLYSQTGAHCNPAGLGPLGEVLIREMMRLGMIIDIDHMSARALDRAFQITGERDYPVISGHTGLLETSIGSAKSEGQKTPQQLGVIRARGGLVSLILHQGKTATYTPSWRGAVPNDCEGSSKTWAQAYLNAVDRMGGPGSAAVGLASDQGFNEMIRPRCGQSGVTYPITVRTGGTLGKSVVGQRTFDFNADGLAHIGMLPDFIEDLKKVGLTDQDLTPLFRSAEQYIRMWEKAQVPPIP